MENIRIVLGRNIRHEREKKRLTQVQLSVLADVSLTALCSAERGSQNMTLDTVERIARALQLSLVDLLNEQPKGADR